MDAGDSLNVADAFDADLGIETAGVVRRGRYATDSPNWRHGTRYQAVDARVLGQLLDALPIDPAEHVFVDFGSGKGRAVLLAAQRPFRRVCGVEFIPELDAIARRNLAQVRDRLAAPVQLVRADASTWPLPDVPLVAFLYNPFGEPVLGRVLARLAADSPHPRWLLTVNVAMPDGHGFRQITGFGPAAVWRTAQGAAGSAASSSMVRATHRAIVAGS